MGEAFDNIIVKIGEQPKVVFDKKSVNLVGNKIEMGTGDDLVMECHFPFYDEDIFWKKGYEKKNLQTNYTKYDFDSLPYAKIRKRIFKNLTEADSDLYFCGTNAQPNRLSVDLKVFQSYPPTITSSFNDTMQHSEGVRLTLVCKVDGYPLPTLSWYRNDIKFEEKQEQLEQQTFVLKNSEIIVFNPVKTDSVNYSCVAENIVGRQTKSVSVVIEGSFFMFCTDTLN
jgi:Immunoglobulin domain